MRGITGLLAGLVVAALVAVGAVAAPSLEAAIGECAAQTDTTARLRCYDAIAAQLKSAPPPAATAAVPAVAPTVAAAPPPKPAVSPVQDFGSEYLGKEEREAVGKPEPLDEIHAIATAISFSPTGRAIITLDNGQVWRQVGGDSEHFRGRVGDTIKVSRGFLGSYNLTTDRSAQMLKVGRVQ